MTGTQNAEILSGMKSKGILFTERIIPFDGQTIKILYIKQLIDAISLSEQIIKPLVLRSKAAKPALTALEAMESVIYAGDCYFNDKAVLIEELILSGMVIILFSNEERYIVANIKKPAHRDIPSPEIVYTIRGPRDCFTESLDVNISLIRYRIKDPNLKIDALEVGARSKTSVAVMYLKDIANDTVVSEVKKRINATQIDSLWDTGELQNLLQNNEHDLFPQVGTSERSDLACEALIEGKVVILMEGSQIGLFAPHVFSESMIASDDQYDNKFFGLFSRVIRYIALFLTLCLSSVYVALVAFHSDVLPVDFTIQLAEMRHKVLFPALFEVLIIEFIVELIRESLLRVPKKIGTAIGVVGAIVIGQAATAAGLFSPFLLIITATSLMASFAIPDYFAVNPIRMLKFFVIIMTGWLGFYGFALAITIILTNLVSINSFGVPYLAPFAPFNMYDFIRQLIFSKSFSPYRPKYLRDKDEIRAETQSSHDKSSA